VQNLGSCRSIKAAPRLFIISSVAHHKPVFLSVNSLFFNFFLVFLGIFVLVSFSSFAILTILRYNQNAKIISEPIFNGSMALNQALRPRQRSCTHPRRLHTSRMNENDQNTSSGLSKEEFLGLARMLNVRGPKSATLAASLTSSEGKNINCSPTVQFDPCLQRLSQNSFLLSWLCHESYGSALVPRCC
jgi:hypothetical protein